jgi:hypothetical protein
MILKKLTTTALPGGLISVRVDGEAVAHPLPSREAVEVIQGYVDLAEAKGGSAVRVDATTAVLAWPEPHEQEALEDAVRVGEVNDDGLTYMGEGEWRRL